jgi:hypothetical protein
MGTNCLAGPGSPGREPLVWGTPSDVPPWSGACLGEELKCRCDLQLEVFEHIRPKRQTMALGAILLHGTNTGD